MAFKRHRDVERVVSHPFLVRDKASRAVINTNTSDFMRRHQHKKASKRKDDEVKSLTNEIQQLKELVAALSKKVDKKQPAN